MGFVLMSVPSMPHMSFCRVVMAISYEVVLQNFILLFKISVLDSLVELCGRCGTVNSHSSFFSEWMVNTEEVCCDLVVARKTRDHFSRSCPTCAPHAYVWVRCVLHNKSVRSGRRTVWVIHLDPLQTAINRSFYVSKVAVGANGFHIRARKTHRSITSYS